MALDHIVSFEKGLYTDGDPANQPAGTYRNSINGRVIFNSNGGFSWTNINGTSSLFAFQGNYGADNTYIPIGYGEFADKIVIFSTNGNNSEIGLAFITENGNSIYQTIYNDIYDPWLQKLGFSIMHEIRDVQCVFENEKIQRIYFTDANDVLCVFNVVIGLTVNSPEFINGDYNPLLSGLYPNFYSAHSMQYSPDFQQGNIKFDHNVAGNLLTGVYQYCYRLVTRDGYKTPFTTPTKHIILTSDPVTSNAMLYQMEASQISSSKGIEIVVKDIDPRFDKIEVAYIYSITNTTSLEAAVFITSGITGTSMTFDHVDNRGTSLQLTDIAQRFTSIIGAKTINSKENHLYLGNVKIAKLVDIDTSGITLAPQLKMMQMDSVSGFNEAIPFVNNGVYNNTTKIAKYIDNTSTTIYESFNIINDYITYRGTQVEHLYGGYFRGEWYRFGLLLFDKKGNPMFVKHMVDIKMTEHYARTFTTLKLDTNGNIVSGTITSGSIGDYLLTNNQVGLAPFLEDTAEDNTIRADIMGMVFNNIDLTSVIDDIGGFSIVRVERDPTILMQGLLLNTVNEVGTGSTDPNVTRPLGYPGNYFTSGFNWKSNSTTDIHGRDDKNYLICGNTFTYDSPDYMFDNGAIPTLQQNHKLKVISGVYQSFSSSDGSHDSVADNRAHGWRDAGADLANGNPGPSINRWGLYAKCYNTGLSFVDYNNNATSFPQSSTIAFYKLFVGGDVIKGYDTTKPNYEFDAVVNLQHATGMVASRRYDAVYNQNGILIKLDSIFDSSITIGHADTDTKVAYQLANYIIDGKVPYGGLSADSLATTVYIPCGHFQPITDAIKAQIVTVVGGQNKYIFNGVEVWGGDCYINPVAYARTYGANSTGDNIHNIAMATVFPTESKYNFALRKGRRWEKTGFADDGTHYPTGVNKLNTEENNLNVVTTYSETNALYFGTPINFSFTDLYSVRWYYSNSKFYGELTDSFRQVLVNNFNDLDGRYGSIQASQYNNDAIYSFQEFAFGKLRIFERRAVSTAAAGNLNIGTGSVLDNIKYESTVYGTQHQLSIVNTDKALYWVDASQKSIVRFAGNGVDNLSNSKGIHNYMHDLFTLSLYDFSYDNPTYGGGIISVFDTENQEALFTFKNRPDLEVNNKPLTLGYSEVLDHFSGFYTFRPSIYFTFGSLLMSYNDTSLTSIYDINIYLHNAPILRFTGQPNKGTIYGALANSQLDYITVQHPTVAKIFDNQEIVSNNTANGLGNPIISNISLSTDEITSPQTITTATDSRFVYRESRYVYPTAGLTDVQRLRGLYLLTSLLITNTTPGVLAQIKSVKTYYRFSRKM